MLTAGTGRGIMETLQSHSAGVDGVAAGQERSRPNIEGVRMTMTIVITDLGGFRHNYLMNATVAILNDR